MELRGEICVSDINLGVISTRMIFKVKRIIKVTERLPDLMVVITRGLVTTSVVEYLWI